MIYSKTKLSAIIAVLFLCAASLTAQSRSSVAENNPDAQNLSQSQIEESQFTFDDNVQDTVDASPRPVSGFWVFVRMILVLGLVIGVIYFIFRLMKKTIEPGADNDPFLRKVAGINIGPGKSVQIVTLIDKGYLLGVSDNSVNLICEIEDKELINALNVHADKVSSNVKAKNFAEVLEMFMPKKNNAGAESGTKTKASGGVFDSSTEDLINSIKRKKMDTAEKEETAGKGEEQ